MTDKIPLDLEALYTKAQALLILAHAAVPDEDLRHRLNEAECNTLPLDQIPFSVLKSLMLFVGTMTLSWSAQGVIVPPKPGDMASWLADAFHCYMCGLLTGYTLGRGGELFPGADEALKKAS